MPALPVRSAIQSLASRKQESRGRKKGFLIASENSELESDKDVPDPGNAYSGKLSLFSVTR